MAREGQLAVYEAENDRYLQQARRQGLFTQHEERRLRAIFRATAADPRRGPASVLPRMLLAQEASSHRATARWSLYEVIRCQTRESLMSAAA